MDTATRGWVKKLLLALLDRGVSPAALEEALVHADAPLEVLHFLDQRGKRRAAP